MSDTDDEGQSGNDAAARFRTHPGGVRRSQAGIEGAPRRSARPLLCCVARQHDGIGAAQTRS
ncbi:MAG: hypothetical protein LC808_36980, partial [Actinobacteria bacterium]|nr:hypothetical protein [Actinomycetota bacterium]